MSTYQFHLPDIGEGLEEAEIIDWLVAVGDTIRRDQPMVEILTDKSQTELPAPTAGLVLAVYPAVGDIAKVGDLLIEIGTVAAATASATETPAVSAPITPSSVAPPPLRDPTTGTPHRPKAAPAVRRRAREAGIDLRTVVGSGPGDRITDGDLRSAEPQQVAAVSGSIGAPIATADATQTPRLGHMTVGQHPLRGIRRVTAKAMDIAWSIPHIHGMDEIDTSNLLSGRIRIKQIVGPAADHLTPLAFLVTAVARALRRYPVMNASIDVANGVITVHKHVNIGIAVATEDGLLVPVITDADQRDLFDLSAEIGRLSAAARDRSIRSTDLREGTCTISNYGSLGGRFATPIIRAPEVAIVGFGAIRQRPFVIDGAVVARQTLPIATGADHRLIDGDVLTAFQEHIVALVTDPVALMVT